MKHQRWWCYVIYRTGCPACKVRQLRYGFRLDPVGYNEEIDNVRRSALFTPEARRWILSQCKKVFIEY